MTPSEKGAFCGKCQIDVIDFSDKSPLEVRQILEASAGKHLCGRFKKTQLDDLNERYADWENQDSRTLLSKFLFALVLVFGMTLFSCGDNPEMIMGDISIEEYHETVKTDSTGHTDQMEAHFENYGQQIENDTPVVRQDWKHVKGKVAYNPEIEEEPYIKGEIAMMPDSLKTGSIPETSQPDILGQVVYNPMPAVPPVNCGNPVETDPDSTVTAPDDSVIPIEAEAPGFSLKLYPNPTRDVAVVVIETQKEAYFIVDLFDLTGHRISSVFKGYLPSGNQRFEVPMAAYEPGNYMVTVTSNGETQTVKIQKVE